MRSNAHLMSCRSDVLQAERGSPLRHVRATHRDSGAGARSGRQLAISIRRRLKRELPQLRELINRARKGVASRKRACCSARCRNSDDSRFRKRNIHRGRRGRGGQGTCPPRRSPAPCRNTARGGTKRDGGGGTAPSRFSSPGPPPPRLLGDTRFPLTAARKEEQKYKRPRYSINNETRTR